MHETDQVWIPPGTEDLSHVIIYVYAITCMVAIERRLATERLATAMVLQVHDELVLEVAEAEIERVRVIVQQEMEGVFALTVPLRVDLGVGHNWAEAH